MRNPLILLLMLCSSVVWAQALVPDPCETGPELYRAGDFVAAKKVLRECIETSGPSLQVLLPLVVMGVREGNLDEAVADGAVAVELAPTDVDARYWYGRALLRSDKPSAAKQQWETGLSLSTEHLGILEGLSRLALAEHEPAKAYQLLGRLQTVGAKQPWAQRLMAEIAADKGLWQQSLGHLEEAMVLEGGGKAGDLLTAAELSIMTGNKSQGVAYCRQAVIMEPGAETYGGLGKAYLTAGAVDSAIVYLRLAVDHDAQAPLFRFNLANALEISGAIDEAELHFQKFLEQVPDDAVGHFNYAVHLQKMGRDAEALISATRAVELDGEMLTARIVQVQLLEELGRWDEALAQLDVLKSRDTANKSQIDNWARRLVGARQVAVANAAAGNIHILDLVVSSPEMLARVQAELTSPGAFAELVVRYSVGVSAAKGGDIGWVNPAEMLPELEVVLRELGMNEISPPIESKGLYHIFKRIP